MKILITETQFDYIINEMKFDFKSLFKKDKIKDGVGYVFAMHPKLSDIGTPSQYSKYLDSIYPSSKFKNIVFHGSLKGKFEKMDKQYYMTYWTTSWDYLMSSPIWASYQTAAILNVKNPLYSDKPMGDVDPDLTPQYMAPRYTPEKYDAVIGIDSGQESYGGLTIAVRNKIVDVHILGTKDDMEGFKKFVKR